MEAATAIVDANAQETLLSLAQPYPLHGPPEEAEEASAAPEQPPVIGNTADVAYQIRQVNECLAEAEGFRSQAEEAKEFYDRRIAALEARAEFLKENVGRWLKLNGMQKLSTHSGTIFFAKRTKVTLPEEDVLLEWAIDQDPSNSMGLYKTVVNKGDLKRYIESSGHKPEGYLEEKVEGITIRKVA